MGAQHEVKAEVGAALTDSDSLPHSHARRLAQEEASKAYQGNNLSQLVGGNGYPPACSTADADHGLPQRQQSQPPEEQEQQRLPQHQQQQGSKAPASRQLS